MKKMMLTICICVIALAGSAFGVPVAQVVAPGPGAYLPFTGNANIVTYGTTPNASGWSFDGWCGYTSVATNGLLRINPTLAGSSTKTQMREDLDWIFSATYRHTGDMTNEWPMAAKYDWDGSREDRMFGVSADKGAGTYGYWIGAAGGGLTSVVTGLTLAAWQDMTVHYKAATHTMDFYWGNTLVAADKTTGHGRYDVDFIQMEWTKAGGDSWREIKLVQVVPEPASMVLLGIGSLALIRRRKA